MSLVRTEPKRIGLPVSGTGLQVQCGAHHFSPYTSPSPHLGAQLITEQSVWSLQRSLHPLLDPELQEQPGC